MNVKFINPFINAAKNILNTMCRIEPTIGKVFLKDGNAALGDISGIIGFAGKEKGSFSITFTENAILKIASRMLNEKFTQLSREVCDAVGEITNIISGNARNELAEKGFNFEMAIPNIIKGKNHSIQHIASGPVLVIPFKIDNAKFFIEICFNRR